MGFLWFQHFCFSKWRQFVFVWKFCVFLLFSSKLTPLKTIEQHFLHPQPKVRYFLHWIRILQVLCNICLWKQEHDKFVWLFLQGCTCDLTGNSCDVNCCCDPDCSASEREAFTSCQDVDVKYAHFCVMFLSKLTYVGCLHSFAK